MDDTDRRELERRIQDLHDQRELDRAAEVAMRGYGGEIWHFLVALHRRDEEAAQETFSMFAEGLWRSLPGFRWHCSFRTWAYAIARKSSLRQRRDARRRAARNRMLPEGSSLSLLVGQIPRDCSGTTQVERRTKLMELREALPEEDQALLMLRVDRQLAWNDLAHVLGDDSSSPLAGEDLAREAARLRKRFQSVRKKLREAAEREGLIPPKS
jgi:RNA polymerase sigma-70 factor, ECF subfamily